MDRLLCYTVDGGAGLAVVAIGIGVWATRISPFIESIIKARHQSWWYKSFNHQREIGVGSYPRYTTTRCYPHPTDALPGMSWLEISSALHWLSCTFSWFSIFRLLRHGFDCGKGAKLLFWSQRSGCCKSSVFWRRVMRTVSGTVKFFKIISTCEWNYIMTSWWVLVYPPHHRLLLNSNEPGCWLDPIWECSCLTLKLSLSCPWQV